MNMFIVSKCIEYNLRRRLSTASSMCTAPDRTLQEVWGEHASQSELSLPSPRDFAATETSSDPGARCFAIMMAESLSNDEASGTRSCKRITTKQTVQLNGMCYDATKRTVGTCCAATKQTV